MIKLTIFSVDPSLLKREFWAAQQQLSVIIRRTTENRRTDGGRARVFHCGKVPLPLPLLFSAGGLARSLALSLLRPQLSSLWRGGTERVERTELEVSSFPKNRNWTDWSQTVGAMDHRFFSRVRSIFSWLHAESLVYFATTHIEDQHLY